MDIDSNERDKDKTTSSSANNNVMEDDASLKLSTKLEALLRHLNQIRQEDKMTEKCVIFSQLYVNIVDLFITLLYDG